MEEVRASSGGLVRATVVEQPGLKVSALLVDSLPGEEDTCGKQDCNPCRSGTTRRRSCHRSTRGGMVYWCKCDTCQEEGQEAGQEVVSLYHGRTSRCLYTCQKEHLKGLAAKKEDNALWKHQETFHQVQPPKFSFGAERFFKDSCSCGIFEGVSINRSPSTDDHLMNSKAEFDQGQVARVVLETGLRW